MLPATFVTEGVFHSSLTTQLFVARFSWNIFQVPARLDVVVRDKSVILDVVSGAQKYVPFRLGWNKPLVAQNKWAVLTFFLCLFYAREVAKNKVLGNRHQHIHLHLCASRYLKR